MVVTLAGALAGAGIMFGIAAFRRRPAVAPPVLNPLDYAAPAPEADREWAARLGRPLGRRLAALGLPRASIRGDLVVLERPAELHLAGQSATAVAGLLLPWALQVLLAAGGYWLPAGFFAGASLFLSGTFFWALDVGVARKASQARGRARTDLSVFLDVTACALASGIGIDQALGNAAERGDSPAFARLRQGIDQAFLGRTPVHEVFAELGRAFGLPELADLASSLALAGSEGAKVRTSLAAKAESIRAGNLSDEEAAAASATERMAIPVGLLMTGFMVVLGWPALAHAVSAL